MMATITKIFPSIGRAGTTFKVFGMGLDAATAVTIGGVPASFSDASPTSLTVTAGSASGAVVVTAGSTVTGPAFTVTRHPSDREIVRAFGALIAEADPDAKIIPYRALMFAPELGENARILQKSNAGDSEIRSWMVFLDALPQTPFPMADPNANPARVAQASLKLDLLLKYALWGFYDFDSGSKDANSHDLLRETAFKLLDKLRAEPDARLTDGRTSDQNDVWNVRNVQSVACDFPRILFGNREIEVCRMTVQFGIRLN